MTLEMLLEGLTRWEWWAVAGITLLVIEAFSSTEFLVWIGLAALTLALIAASVEPRWEFNLVLFSILSFTYTLAGRRYWRKVGTRTDDPTLNHRSQALVGRRCTVEQRVTEADGRVRVGDTTWSAIAAPGKGPFEPGTEVQITNARGVLLIVDAPRDETGSPQPTA